MLWMLFPLAFLVCICVRSQCMDSAFEGDIVPVNMSVSDKRSWASGDLDCLVNLDDVWDDSYPCTSQSG